MKRVYLAVALIFGLLISLAIGLKAFDQPKGTQVFVSDQENYSVELPIGWSSQARESGTIFLDQAGQDQFEVLVFADLGMTPEYFGSQTMVDRLRESYHEAYDTPESEIEVVVVDRLLTISYRPDPGALALLNRLSGSKLEAEQIVEQYQYHQGLTYLIRQPAGQGLKTLDFRV